MYLRVERRLYFLCCVWMSFVCYVCVREERTLVASTLHAISTRVLDMSTRTSLKAGAAKYSSLGAVAAAAPTGRSPLPPQGGRRCRPHRAVALAARFIMSRQFD